MKKKNRRVYTTRRANRRVPSFNKERLGRIWRTFWKLTLCVMFISFLVMDGYRFARVFQHWRRNREIKQEYVQEVQRLRQGQQRLKEEIYELQNRPLAQERLAREMGYIKPGEIVYKFMSKLNDATSGPID